MKNKPILYVIHFLGNSDLKIRKDIPEELKNKLSLTPDRNFEDKYLIKQIDFRNTTKKILDNLEVYKDYLLFEIVNNELNYLNKLFPNHLKRFIFIYTDQKNVDEIHKNKDSIFLAEIIKKLQIVEVEDFLKLEKADNEFLLFNKLLSKISELESKKKVKTDYIFFTSAGVPTLKVVGTLLTLLNSIYTSSTFLRAEINESGELKILNQNIFKLIANSFMNKNFLDALAFIYLYLPIIRNISKLNPNLYNENLDKIDLLITYLYKRLILSFFEEEDIEKFREQFKKFNIMEEYDFLLSSDYEESIRNLLSKIQDLDLFLKEGKIKEAVLSSIVILDLLKEVLEKIYKIKDFKLKNEEYYLKKKDILEKIDINSNTFYSILPFLYESDKEKIRQIKDVIFGDDKIINVEKKDNKIIFNDLIISLRNQRNDLAHKGYFKGNPKKLLNKINNLYNELFRIVIDQEFKEPFTYYKEKLDELLKELN